MTITVQRWDDGPSWNEFVASIPGAHFQQSWEWGELAPLLGGRAFRLAAVCGNTPVGGMQVFSTSIRGTNRSLLYVPRGPAVRRASVELLGPLCDAARRLAADQHAAGLRIEPNAPGDSTEWQKTLAALGFRATWPPSQPRSSWVLDVDRPPEALLAGMKSKTRYNIRLAARKDVTVSEGSRADLDEFYRLYRETAARDDFAIQDKSFYGTMFQLFESAGNFAMLLARYQGKLIASVTLVRFGSTCWYVHGASSNEHRNLMATYLLQWEAIQRARAWGCSLYDFRAVPDRLREDQDMYGVYRFKEGFGGHQVTALHTHTLSYDPVVFGLWQTYFSARFALQEWRRRRRKLPARQFA